MTCHICGGQFENVLTNVPFKVADDSIVIFKSLPVLQCRNCGEYLIEDAVIEEIETILSNFDTNVELRVLSYGR